VSAVRAEAVSFAYGDRMAVAPSDFDIPLGARTAVIGPNGSGKSTVLSGIAGLRHPTAGTLTVLGNAPGSAATGVSYVLQSTKLNEAMPITVAEVVAMGRYASLGLLRRWRSRDAEACRAAIDVMDLSDLADLHLGELSGGQRQRVFIAQGLAQDHELLLLDEPLTGLDMVSAATIETVLVDELARGKTVVMTTHDLSEAAAADYVVLLAGRVVASGPPETVLTAANLADAYGQRALRVEDGEMFIDDPAHSPVPGRHVHSERIVHPESPGSDLH